MQIIHHAHSRPPAGLKHVVLEVERSTLAKRRWRGVAEDGREFGFDLDQPLTDGAMVFEEAETAYVLKQKAEPVLVVALHDEARTSANLARLGWLIGNLHFPLALEAGEMLVPDDPALRQLFDRERIAFTAYERVFKPLSGGHSHAHDDDHHH